jgi:hypothetical protein
VEGWFNVKEYGATGDGNTDDTKSINQAISAANHSVVYFPPGTYRVSSEIVVTDHDYFGCSLVGANAQAVQVVPLSNLTDKDRIFVFRGGSGAFSNVGIKNMTIVGSSHSSAANRCVGVYVDGQCFSIFENVRFQRLKYGVWLHNQSSRAYSELNQFNQLELAFCENGIRIEQGGGAHSFHGNDFNNCYFNVAEGQIGFNHVSGFLYNARFRLFMWGHSPESTYINADGNAIDNIGDITYESFKPGKLTGSGRFWFNGFLRGRGKPNDGINDQTTPQRPWEQVIACDNYWKSTPYADSGMTAGPLKSPNDSMQGPLGFFQSLRKHNVESVVLNTYSGADENGLYLGRSGYQKNEEAARLGLFLSGKGDKIKSFHDRPLIVESAWGMEVRAGAAPGYSMLGGTIAVEGGGNYYQWNKIFSFSSLVSGRLICLSEEKTVCAIVDVVWTEDHEALSPVSEIAKKNQERHEHIVVKVTKEPPRELQIGTNFRRAGSLYWYFHGISL